MRINDFKMRNSGLDKNCKYHLFTSKKGKEEFIKNIESKISERKPSVDISELCEQFYN